MSTSERFTFRLGRLLSMRERKAEQAAVALAQAIERADGVRAALAETQARRESARSGLFPGVGRAGELGDRHAAQVMIEHADRRATALAASLAEAEAQVEACRKALSHCMTEQKALEKLRERQAEEWRREMERRARAAMDAVALRISTHRPQPEHG